MISLTYKFNGADWPLTIEESHLLAFFMNNKGIALDLFIELLKQLKNDENDIVRLKIKQIKDLAGQIIK